VIISYQPISIDDYAHLEQANGISVINVDGQWWIESKPRFYRPLFPFTRLNPGEARYPDKIKRGGFQHAVKDAQYANSTLHYFVYDDLSSYSMEDLSKNRRKKLKKAIQCFHAERMEDAAEFAEQAYPVYLDFYRRTRYGFKSERLDKKHFSRWTQYLFEFTNLLILGIYLENRLSAVSISYQVEDVVIDATLFCNDQCLNLNILDYQTHLVREAAVSSSAKTIFLGRSTGKRSLDESKMNRGCKILHRPAYFKLNPFVSLGLKWCCRNKYNRLIGELDYLI
jgi:hypothetical protein